MPSLASREMPSFYVPVNKPRCTKYHAFERPQDNTRESLSDTATIRYKAFKTNPAEISSKMFSLLTSCFIIGARVSHLQDTTAQDTVVWFAPTATWTRSTLTAIWTRNFYSREVDRTPFLHSHFASLMLYLCNKRFYPP